jgi:integrase
MSTLIEKKLFFGRYREDYQSPDTFFIDYDQHKIDLPDNNFILTRTETGDTLSKFGDNKWNFSPYTIDKKCIINFIKIKREDSYFLIKKILFLMMVVGYNNRSYSPGVLYNTFRCLRDMELYGVKNNLTLFDLLTDSYNLRQYFLFLEKNKESFIAQSSTLINFLRKRSHYTKVPFIEDKFINSLIVRTFKKIRRGNQTLVIPLNIYRNSLVERFKQINEIENNIDNLVNFIKNIQLDKNYAISIKDQQKSDIKTTNWDIAIINHNLSSLFYKYNINTKRDLKSFISNIQSTIAHLIAAYTGMRKLEVSSLKQNSIVYTDNTINIRAVVTKFKKTAKKDKWASHKIIIPAVTILEKLSLALQHKFATKNDSLFISTKHLSHKDNSQIAQKHGEIFSNTLPLNKDLITISEQDLFELMHIDPKRDWQNEKVYCIGKPFIFKAHQYRRSLIVYAKKSNLVSDRVLKKQAKHRDMGMQFHYQNGFHFARNILKPDIKDYYDVINEKNKISKQSNEEAKKICTTQESSIEVNLYNNRKKTIENSINGLQTYHETKYGGCSSITCQKNTDSIISIILSSNKNLKQENILQAIGIQQNIVNSLEKDSVQYILEKRELNLLIKYLQHGEI